MTQKKTDEERRKDGIRIPLTPAERQQIERLAAAEDLPLATLIRRRLDLRNWQPQGNQGAA